MPEKDRFYYTNEECLYEQEFHKGFFMEKNLEQLFSQNQEFQNLYVILINTLGLNKISVRFHHICKILCMIVFVFFGLLQRKIWSHPAIVAYIIPYFHRERQAYMTRAVKFIEKVHLDNWWAYQFINIQLQVFSSLQNRVDKKVQFWENLLLVKTSQPVREQEQLKLLSATEDNEQSIFLINFNYQSEQLQQKQKEEQEEDLKIKSEKYSLKQFAPILPIHEVYIAFKDKQGNKKEAEKLIKIKQRTAESKVLEDIYSIKEIGIDKFYPELQYRLVEEQQIIDKLENSKLEEEQDQNQIQDDQTKLQTLEEDIKSKKSLKSQQQSQQLSSTENESSLWPSTTSSRTSVQKNKEEKQISSFDGLVLKLTIFFNKVNIRIKNWLVQFIYDIFLYDNYEQKLRKDINSKSFMVMVALVVVSNFEKICFVFFILNTIVNANLLSFIYVISLFCYALIENPIPQKGYWKFMIFYTIVIIILKFLYQLPIFCGSPPYSLFHYDGDVACENIRVNPSDLINRIDFIIGIRKFSGNSSYPKNHGLFLGLIWDYLVLFSLLIHRYLLETLGFWNYVRTDESMYYIPQFQSANRYKQVEENGEYKSIKSSEIEILEEEKPDKKFSLEGIYQGFIGFIMRLLPWLLPHTHKNNSGVWRSTLPQLIKPGRDFYPEQITMCLCLLFFFILCYSEMIGKRETIAEQLGNKSAFSGELVIVIILIILWIIADRTIYILSPTVDKETEIQESMVENKIHIQETEQNEKKKKKSYTMVFKAILHFSLVILAHIELCLVIPIQSKVKLNVFFFDNSYLVVCYVLFCIYFYFSSQQLKYGYPQIIKGQIFTDQTDVAHRLAFKFYRAIPFLTELRNIIDWTISKTSLDLFQWIKLDDAYTGLYVCKAEMAIRHEHRFGSQRKFFEKFTNGCCLILFLVLIIIGPILIFSTLNPILEINNVNSGSITLEIITNSVSKQFHSTQSAFQFKIFEVNNLDIQDLSHEEFKSLKQEYQSINVDWEKKMQKITILPYSETIWDISPPSLEQLRKLLKSQNETIFLSAKWNFLRSHPPGAELARGSNTIFMNLEMKNALLKIVSNEESAKHLKLEAQNLFPNFITLGQTINAQSREFISYKQKYPSNINCVLEYGIENSQKYWMLLKKEDQSEIPEKNNKAEQIIDEQKGVTLILINDLVFGSLFGKKEGENLSILGLYATLVFAIGKFIRILFDKVSTRVIYEEMPHTDDIWDLCESIYIARIEGDLKKEQRLYDLLIRIYRSPEILLKLTGSQLNYKRDQ